MKRRNFYGIAFPLCLCLLVNNANGYEAGQFDGAFSVDEMGAANYSIPLNLSPGTAGMQPSLSLNYSSQGGSGLLGLGWNVGGLSKITRCPATLAQDGFIDAVDFDDNDRFCIDGQRLIAVQGDYGAHDTEYRTEIDSFVRVISYDTNSINSGPEYFKAWTKSGQVMEYGLTQDSRVEASNSATVKHWEVNKIGDTLGNFINFNYYEDTNGGESYIQSIEYTGNDNEGLAPYNSVIFFYEQRAFPLISFVGGSKVQITKRLKTIKIISDDNPVWEYRLTYSQYSTRELLTSITHCDALEHCLAPIQFSWQQGEDTFDDFEKWWVHNSNNGPNVPQWRDNTGVLNDLIDMDGDGLLDRVAHHNYQTNEQGIWVALNNGSGFDPQTLWHTSTQSRHRQPEWSFSGGLYTQLIDLNGDGRPDFTMHHNYVTNQPGLWVALNNGGGFDDPELWLTSSESYQQIPLWRDSTGIFAMFMDMNADGLPDRITHYNYDTNQDGLWVALNNGSGFENPARWFYSPHSGQLNRPLWEYSSGVYSQLIDMNGDGLPDKTAHHNYETNQPGFWVALNNGNGFDPMQLWAVSPDQNQHLSQWQYSGGVYLLLVDMNADSLPDRVLHYDYIGGGPGLYVAFNNGKGFEEPELWLNHPQNNGPNLPIYAISSGSHLDALQDMNGDGRPDRIFHRHPLTQQNGFWVALNIGTGFTEPVLWWQSVDTGQHRALWSSNNYTYKRLADMDGDGITDQVMHNDYSGGGPSLWITKNKNTIPLIETFTSALSATTQVNYSSLKRSQQYQYDASPDYPFVHYSSAMHIVESVSVDDGIGGQRETSYEYTNALYDLNRQHFAGFASMCSTDESTGIATKTFYRQDFPFNGQVQSTQTRLADGALISESSSEYDVMSSVPGTSVQFPHIKKLIKKSYELDGSWITTITTENIFDDFGNPLEITVITEGGGDTFITQTLNAYENHTQSWMLGRLTRTDVTQTLPDGVSATRSSAFAYNAIHGLLEQEIVEPDNLNFRLTTDYAFDGFGNTISVTTSGQNIQTRSSTTSFDARGRFAITNTNALGHTASSTWDQAFGLALTQSDANGLTSAWQYDGFGRENSVTRPDQTQTTITREWCDGFNGEIGNLNCPDGGVLVMTTLNSGSVPASVYLDRLGRTLREETTGFDGAPIFVDTRYDELGQAVQKTRPYFDGDMPLWHSFEYDISGRIVRENSPDGSYTETIHSGLTMKTQNDLGQMNTQTKNARGDLIEVIDSMGHQTFYRHDAFGNLSEVEDAYGNITTNTFDIRGRKIAMDDPDMGSWTYQYNVLGELIAQTDAKGQTVTNVYDRLGRMISRTENEGTSTWVYDTAENGIGLLASENGAEGESKDYHYDSLSRRYRTITTIDGTAYTISNNFDEFGRLKTITYPTSSSYPTGFAISYIYNARGYLAQVEDSATEQIYWQAEEQNAEGQLTEFSLGNGITTQQGFDSNTGLVDFIHSALTGFTEIQHDRYTFDTIGNLTSREHVLNNLLETSNYDNLNRLTHTTLDGETKTYSYDALGNILSKTGIGSYNYDGPRPHAVTNVAGKSMTYDANGNMVQGWNFTAGESRTIIWTSYNKPLSIIQGATTLQFSYGADRVRFKQINSNGKTTLYVGGLYEKEITTSGITHIHYVRAGGDTIAIHKAKEDSQGQPIETQMRYLHKDHIGSISVITNEIGEITEAFSYDPHGKRRSALDWSDVLYQIQAFETKRSFTGHEYLDDVGLIHMNGRVYDPDLGRFLSPDPMVQEPTNAQNLNRYSYVLNNPLSATDPSGFLFGFLKKAVKAALGVVRNIFRAIGRNTILNSIAQIGAYIGCGGGISGAACAAAISGATTAANGGSIGDVIKSSTITFASAYAFGRADEISNIYVKSVAHGIIGGTSSSVSGGKFISGFLSSGSAQFLGGQNYINNLGTIEKGIVKALIGGTSSSLGGGKFTNGAATAALAYATSVGLVAGRNPTLQERTYAKLAAGVYDDKYLGADGYLSVDSFVDESGLKAALFVNEGGHYVLAFAGTNPTSWANWRANLSQALGFDSAQYNAGIKLAQQFHHFTGGNIQFTGHSLGGGIATASAISTGGNATIFNAAGLHSNYLNVKFLSNPNISYFYSSFDVLHLGNWIAPTKIPGEHISLGRAGMHGMNGICQVTGC